MVLLTGFTHVARAHEKCCHLSQGIFNVQLSPSWKCSTHSVGSLLPQIFRHPFPPSTSEELQGAEHRCPCCWSWLVLRICAEPGAPNAFSRDAMGPKLSSCALNSLPATPSCRQAVYVLTHVCAVVHRCMAADIQTGS